MKTTTIFFYVLLMFGLMSSVTQRTTQRTTPNLTPPSSLESSTEFLGYLENGQYCYFRNTIINQGSYYFDRRCKEFVVRNASGNIVRTDTLWTEDRSTTTEKDNSIILRKYKSTFNVFKFLSDNKANIQEDSRAYVHLYNKVSKNYEMLELKLFKGDLYLYSDKNFQRSSKVSKDSILIYDKKENVKNLVAHLDNFLLEYENIFSLQKEKPKNKTDIMNTSLSNEEPKIKATYYYKKMFLVQLEWKRGDDSGEDFDTYFTIPENLLEKSLEKLLKK